MMSRSAYKVEMSRVLGMEINQVRALNTVTYVGL